MKPEKYAHLETVLATLKATAKDGSGVQATAEVTVGEDMLKLDTYYLTGNGVEGAMEEGEGYQVLKYENAESGCGEVFTLIRRTQEQTNPQRISV